MFEHQSIWGAALKTTFTLLFLLSGCNLAVPEELPDQSASSETEDHVAFSTNRDTIQLKPQLKPRPNYFRKITHPGYLLHIAAQEMRSPAPELSRNFFITPEEKGMAFSIGDTRDGYLINGQSLPEISLELRQLPIQFERGIAYGTPNLIKIVTDTAHSMQKKYPGSVMYLGNLGLREGGDIPYSVSHNAGRDADIAFYLKNSEGQQAHNQNMYKVSGRLLAYTPEGTMSFDLDKNTTLIETLLMHPQIHIQFIFAAKHIRSAVHKELIRRGASEELLARFEETVQNQAAHNDHFHIRIYCSPEDICAGCMDKSLIHEYQDDPEPIREKCVAQHVRTLTRGKPDEDHLAAAIQRLALIGVASQYDGKILKHIPDERTKVRSAVAFAAQYMGQDNVPKFVAWLGRENDPSVRLDIITALAAHNIPAVHKAFINELADSRTQGPQLAKILDFIRHYPQADHLDALVTRFQKNPTDSDVLETLSTVTNHPFATEEEILKWVNKNRKLTRNQWLLDGFKQAGYKVTSLEIPSVPGLLDAIDGPRPISINAQLILKKLSHLTQDSLKWPVQDARWHYTRYFKRKAKKYKLDLSDRDDKGNKL